MTLEEAQAVLGVAKGASEVEVKQAYRRLVVIVHPDRGGSNEAFIRVNDAYEILSGARSPAASTSSASATTTPTQSYLVASVAMRLLNLDPDEFVDIENVCYAWLGSVSQTNKRAAKQLLWLAAGRIPIGAAKAVVKGQSYKSAAKNMLASLADLTTKPGQMQSPDAWMNFAECYLKMLRLSGLKSVAKQFSRAEFMQALSAADRQTRPSPPRSVQTRTCRTCKQEFQAKSEAVTEWHRCAVLRARPSSASQPTADQHTQHRSSGPSLTWRCPSCKHEFEGGSEASMKCPGCRILLSRPPSASQPTAGQQWEKSSSGSLLTWRCPSCRHEFRVGSEASMKCPGCRILLRPPSSA